MKKLMKTLCLLSVLFVFVTDTFACNPMATPIALYRRHPIGSSQGPTRSPVPSCEIEAYYDDSSQSLMFYDENESDVTYSLYNEQEELELQGCCTFDGEGLFYVSLVGLSTGVYTLYVSVNGVQYQGVLDLE